MKCFLASVPHLPNRYEQQYNLRMAEPTGIFIDIKIDEMDLKRLLNQKFVKARFGNKLGYYFSELLYRSYMNESDSASIFNYDKKYKSIHNEKQNLILIPARGAISCFYPPTSDTSKRCNWRSKIPEDFCVHHFAATISVGCLFAKFNTKPCYCA